MIKEFNKIEDIYSSPDKDGFQKLIRRNLISKICLETLNIIPQEYINRKGQINKMKCLVKYGEDYLVLNHSYKKIKQIVKDTLKEYQPVKIKGFRYKNKK